MIVLLLAHLILTFYSSSATIFIYINRRISARGDTIVDEIPIAGSSGDGRVLIRQTPGDGKVLIRLAPGDGLVMIRLAMVEY